MEVKQIRKQINEKISKNTIQINIKKSIEFKINYFILLFDQKKNIMTHTILSTICNKTIQIKKK